MKYLPILNNRMFVIVHPDDELLVSNKIQRYLHLHFKITFHMELTNK